MRSTCVGAFVLCSLALGWVDQAQALGLGRPQMRSALGQTLNLEFPLSLNAGESLSADCVKAEVLAGVARLPASAIQVQLQGATDASVRALRVISSVKIEEPIISVSLSLGCPTRLTRQYSALLDPPSSQGHPAGSDIEEIQQAEAPPRYSAVMKAALATSGAQPRDLLGAGVKDAGASQRLTADLKPAKPAKASQTDSAKQNSKSLPQTLAPVKPDRPVKVVSPSPAAWSDGPVDSVGPKLRLESLEAATAASAQASAQLSEAQAALQRLNALELGLGKLREDKRLSELKLKEMQALVRDDSLGSEASASVSPWVLALSLLSLGLAGGCACLWQSLRKNKLGQDSRWWTASDASPENAGSNSSSGVGTTAVVADKLQAEQHATLRQSASASANGSGSDVGAEGRDDERTISLAKLSEVDHSLDFAQPDPLPAHRASTDFGLAMPGVDFVSTDQSTHLGAFFGHERHEEKSEPVSVQFLDGPSIDSVLPSGVTAAVDQDPRGGGGQDLVSAEALIDLEQQVDFFVVLGQHDAAVDLLQERLRHGIDSALPYLKLMEICQQRGEALAFADVAGRYALRFDAQAPSWDQDLSQGRDLEAYPEVLLEVQGRWSDSGASMSLLQKLLSRRAERAANLELPALRDLLLLYSVARDRSEHEVRGQEIDLFLPLESELSSQTGFGMMATMVWQAAPSEVGSPTPSKSSLDVDIVLDDTPPAKL
ncbi:MAG: FimV family protein [Roseateles sp.]